MQIATLGMQIVWNDSTTSEQYGLTAQYHSTWYPDFMPTPPLGGLSFRDHPPFSPFVIAFGIRFWLRACRLSHLECRMHAMIQRLASSMDWLHNIIVCDTRMPCREKGLRGMIRIERTGAGTCGGPIENGQHGRADSRDSNEYLVVRCEQRTDSPSPRELSRVSWWSTEGLQRE